MMRNPIFESSMKRRMRSFRAPMLITLYVLFLLLISSGALSALLKPTFTVSTLRLGMETLIYLSVLQFALIVLVAPALTVSAISGERERQTLDLLLCTRVGAMRIVLGKLLSSVAFLALMIACALPVMTVVLFFGGLTIGQLLMMSLFLLVTAIGCCSIGIFCSAVFKRTVTATVAAYLVIFALGFGTLVGPVLFDYARFRDIARLIESPEGQAMSGAALSASVISMAPKLLFLNPGLGLLSLLVGQTGMLSNTLGQLTGYSGTSFFVALESMGSFAWLNMLAVFGCSVVLVLVSALFVKPAGRKAKKRK